jgi:hypothetical protein
MARPLNNGQVLADQVGAPDFTLPVSILAQVIESLKVDITAQSIPTLNINIASISQGVTVTTTVSNMPSTFPLPSDQISALQQVTIQNVAAGLVLNVNIAQVTATLNIANFPSVYPLPSDQVSTLQQITIQNVAAGLLIPIDIKQVTATLNIANFPSTYPLPSDQVDTLKQITIQNVAAGLVFNVNIAQVTATLNIANFPSTYPLPSDQISSLQQVTIQNVAAGLLIPIDIKQVTATLNIANFPSTYPLPSDQINALQQVTIQNVAAGLYIPINITRADATVNTNANISGVVAGVYVPITIHSVESGVIFNINIAGVASGVVFNVAQSGTWTVNVQTAAGVSLNVNIASITSGVVFNVAQSGTWTVNVQTAAGVSLNVNIASITSGVVFNVAQSGTWTVNVQTAAGVSLNVNIASITSGVVFNVYITGGTTLNVNIASISSGVTFNVYITGGTTLNVSVTSSVDINVKTSSGANIVIDKLTQGAYTERRSDIYNYGTTATMVANNYTYKRGKFFPRGCRGFLQRVWIYCDNTDTVAHTLTVKFSPAPGTGAVYTVSASVAAGSSAAWRYIDVNKFWNYDSMFIWASFDSNTYGRIGYDTGTPYDYYYSTDEATWTPDSYRYWIYVTISGETVGDLPVSGTVNTVNVPNASTAYSVSYVSVPSGVETSMLTVYGCGRLIEARAIFNTSTPPSANVYYQMYIYCDGVLAYWTSNVFLTQSLTATSGRTSAGEFVQTSLATNMHIRVPLEFRRSIELRVYQTTGSTINGCGGELIVSLIG